MYFKSDFLIRNHFRSHFSQSIHFWNYPCSLNFEKNYQSRKGAPMFWQGTLFLILYFLHFSFFVSFKKNLFCIIFPFFTMIPERLLGILSLLSNLPSYLPTFPFLFIFSSAFALVWPPFSTGKNKLIKLQF